MHLRINKDEIKSQLKRLIAEAPQVAPSISRYEETKRYGTVTDDDLDLQAFQRWEVEAVALLNQLAESGSTVFQQLHSQYEKIMQDSQRYHSKSILVHQLMQLITTAIQLLDSPVTDALSKKVPVPTPNQSEDKSKEVEVKEWHEKPLGKIWLTVGGGVLLLCAIYLIRKHLGIPL